MLTSCIQIIRWWSESLDRHIPWWRSVFIKIHMFRCGPCARYRNQVLSTRELHKRAHALEEPLGAMDHLKLSNEEKVRILTAMEQAKEDTQR